VGVPSEGSGIEVHIDGLRDLAKQLRTESDKALGNVTQRARSTLSRGTPFGATSQSGYVYAAKHKYNLAADRALQTLNEYALMAGALADAAEAIAEKYGDSDAFSKAQASDIQREFSTAYTIAKSRQIVVTKAQEAL
jgi:hypothetical protein